MMEEMAKVLSSDSEGWVTVEVQVKNACNHCDSSESCGTSAVASAFSPKVQTFSVQSEKQYQAGQLLKLGLPESVILKAAALVYLLPLFGLFVGAALGYLFLPYFNIDVSDLHIMPIALSGAVGAWFFAKKAAKQMEVSSQPVIISELGHSI